MKTLSIALLLCCTSAFAQEKADHKAMREQIGELRKGIPRTNHPTKAELDKETQIRAQIGAKQQQLRDLEKKAAMAEFLAAHPVKK